MEFSKKLLYFSGAITIVLTTLLICFSIKGLPTNELVEVVRLSWVETGAATGFYYWKSKNENRSKYAQKFLNDFAEKWGSEVAVRMAEIVLKD